MMWWRRRNALGIAVICLAACTASPGEPTIQRIIFFNEDASLDIEALAVAAETATQAHGLPNEPIRIFWFSDVGHSSENMARARGEVVRTYLLKAGISPSRVELRNRAPKAGIDPAVEAQHVLVEIGG
jgi:hypothetical protein